MILVKRKNMHRLGIGLVIAVAWIWTPACRAATHVVANDAELAAAQTKAKPGDTIALKAGQYGKLEWDREGSREQRIVVRAEAKAGKNGRVRFKSLRLGGAYGSGVMAASTSFFNRWYSRCCCESQPALGICPQPPASIARGARRMGLASGCPTLTRAAQGRRANASPNLSLRLTHLVLGRAAFQPAFICSISASSNSLFFGSTAMFSLPAGSVW
jgi:hypothetical protein